MGSYRSIRLPSLEEQQNGRGMPRRDFLRGLAAAGAGSVLASALGPAQRAFAGRPRAASTPASPSGAAVTS